MQRIVTAAIMAIAFAIPSAAQAAIQISPAPSETRLRAACDLVGGTFTRSTDGYGCVNDDCLSNGQPCQVLCVLTRCVADTDEPMDKPTLIKILTGGKGTKDPVPEPEPSNPDVGGVPAFCDCVIN